MSSAASRIKKQNTPSAPGPDLEAYPHPIPSPVRIWVTSSERKEHQPIIEELWTRAGGPQTSDQGNCRWITSRLAVAGSWREPIQKKDGFGHGEGPVCDLPGALGCDTDRWDKTRKRASWGTPGSSWMKNREART